jgi:hypothetical protein
MKHATVPIGEYSIPLIRIPENAVLEECDLCHAWVGIWNIIFNGVQFLCRRCA